MRPARRLQLWRNIATDRIRRLPVVTLMTHSRCNCRCVMCDIWKNNNNPSEISIDAAREWVPALRELRVENLVFSGGEALMHSDLWGLNDVLREAGAQHTLLTTGLLLEKYAEPVAREFNDVIVSLDGSEQVHNEIRNLPRAWAKLASGVAALQAQPGAPTISARCVLQRGNIGDFLQTIAAARQLGLASISFLPADLSSDAFSHDNEWIASDAPATLIPSAAQLQQFERDVSLVEQAGDAGGFVVESAPRLRRIAAYYRALLGTGDLPPVSCNAPWVSVVIETDGRVRPCFFHAPYPGGIRGRDINTVINSVDAIAFRQGLDVASDVVCRSCVCTLTL